MGGIFSYFSLLILLCFPVMTLAQCHRLFVEGKEVPVRSEQALLESLRQYTPAAIQNPSRVDHETFRGGNPFQFNAQGALDLRALDLLVELKVKSVVTILHRNDLAPEKMRQVGAELEKRGIQHKVVGDFLGDLPDTQQKADQLISDMVQVVRATKQGNLGTPIYVHCREGRIRTGLFVAVDRILRGGSADDAALEFWRRATGTPQNQSDMTVMIKASEDENFNRIREALQYLARVPVAD